MRRHRPAQVILPMLALPLLLAGLAILALPEPAALASPVPGHDASRHAPAPRRAPARHHHASSFNLVPRSLMP